MTIGRAAIGAAVVCGLVAVGDAVVAGVTGQNLVDEQSPRWARAATEVVHVGAYLLLAAGLVRLGTAVDDGRRWRAAARWILVVALVLMAGMYAGGALLGRYPGALAAVGGTAFLVHFVMAVVIGVALLRRGPNRRTGAVLASPLVVLPIVALVSLVAPAWAHPAWAEIGVLLGLALLLMDTERATGVSSPSAPVALATSG